MHSDSSSWGAMNADSSTAPALPDAEDEEDAEEKADEDEEGGAK